MHLNDTPSPLLIPDSLQLDPSDCIDSSRRSFLRRAMGISTGILLAPSIFIPRFANAMTGSTEKALSFYNINTGEHLKKCIFWAEGKFVKEGQEDLKKFFRDFRTGEQKEIDPELINLLHGLAAKLETSEPFHLISGYRSPKTNAALRKKSSGVASKSQHPLGKAADISIPGRCLKTIQALAKTYKMGGVGRYSRFVHIDTGPIRYW